MSTQLTRDEALERIETLEENLDVVMNRVLPARREWMEELQAENEELRQENEALRDRLARLEGTVTPDPTAKPYNEKSRDEKVRELRIAIGRKATNHYGKAAMTYTDVLTVFGEHPSRGHAYKLMELAGQLDGFEYDKHGGDSIRLLVNLERVNDEAVLHAVNTTNDEEGR